MPHFLAYVRQLPGLSPEAQLASLHKFGFSKSQHAPLFTERRGGFPRERDEELLPALREGNTLLVARLAVLANDRRELRAVMDRLRMLGCNVIETDTGRQSDGKGCGEMILDAIDYWARNVKTFAKTYTAVQAGSKGGTEAARRRKAEKMPKEAAAVIWFDIERYNSEQAVDAINSDTRFTRKWSSAQLYRDLGPRQAKAGRRPKPRPSNTYEG